MKLHEIGHPYHCSRGNYYARGDQQPTSHYKSWADFMSEEGDSDMDYNLVFRWDWTIRDGKGEDVEPNPDPNYRDGELQVCFMVQRKGLYRWVTIEVCGADDEAVRSWLQGRLDHLMRCWAPIGVREIPTAEVERLRAALAYARDFIGEAHCSGHKCRLPHCDSCFGDDAEEVDWDRLRPEVEPETT